MALQHQHSLDNTVCSNLSYQEKFEQLFYSWEWVKPGWHLSLHWLETQPLLTSWPITFSLVWQTRLFNKFTNNLVLRHWNSWFSTPVRFSQQAVNKIRSSKYLTTLSKPDRILVIILWKEAGDPFTPKSITLYWYRAVGVIKAEIFFALLVCGTWQ